MDRTLIDLLEKEPAKNPRINTCLKRFIRPSTETSMPLRPIVAASHMPEGGTGRPTCSSTFLKPIR
ncbi:MAG: hypothetical protein P0119_05275 [Nitrospira sp.]|nr:hypothetical protein [Nitrospira sp.]